MKTNKISQIAMFLRQLSAAIFFVGWLLPFWIACHFFLKHELIESADALDRYSFPYLTFADYMLTVAFLWLGVASLIWIIATWRSNMGAPS